jgi:hypothetical protein
MLVPVLRYQVDWNTTNNTYRVLVQYAPNPQPVPLQVNSETEFLAALIMLGKPGVMIDNQTKVLNIPVRQAGT